MKLRTTQTYKKGSVRCVTMLLLNIQILMSSKNKSITLCLDHKKPHGWFMIEGHEME